MSDNPLGEPRRMCIKWRSFLVYMIYDIRGIFRVLCFYTHSRLCSAKSAYKAYLLYHESLLMSPLLGHGLSLWIYPQGERAIPTTRAKCGLVGDNDCKYSRDGLTCIPKHGRARDKFLVTHPMTDQCCLASAIERRVH
jgi:hypothetical protein